MLEPLAFLIKNLPYLLVGFPGQRPGGLLLSLLMAMVGVGLGFVIAAIIGSGYESRLRPIRWLCRLYVEVFRGLPLILLLVLVYLVVGGRRFDLKLSPQVAAALSLALYSGAYQAEIVRAGLRAVPQRWVESARLMGSTPWQVYRLVKLRYALRVMLPGLTGQAISLFKDTSVLIVIGVAELMTVARSVLGSDVTNTPHWVGLYLMLGFLYFCVAFSVSQLAQRWERHWRSGDTIHSLSNY